MFNQKGFSIVEIVVVIVIIGFIFLLLSNLPSVIGIVGTNRYESIAKQIVVGKIEDLRSQGYTALANGTTNMTDTRLSLLPISSGQTVIEDCPSSICPNNEQIKKVTTKVNWSESGKPHSTEVVTFISKGGLQ